MIPRFSPMVTAWVRSLAPSLARMFFTWPFTVSSLMESWAAISLLAFPPEISVVPKVLATKLALKQFDLHRVGPVAFGEKEARDLLGLERALKLGALRCRAREQPGITAAGVLVRAYSAAVSGMPPPSSRRSSARSALSDPRTKMLAP